MGCDKSHNRYLHTGVSNRPPPSPPASRGGGNRKLPLTPPYIWLPLTHHNHKLPSHPAFSFFSSPFIVCFPWLAACLGQDRDGITFWHASNISQCITHLFKGRGTIRKGRFPKLGDFHIHLSVLHICRIRESEKLTLFHWDIYHTKKKQLKFLIRQGFYFHRYKICIMHCYTYAVYAFLSWINVDFALLNTLRCKDEEWLF